MEKEQIQQGAVAARSYVDGHAYDGVDVDAFLFLSKVGVQHPFLCLEKQETDCPTLFSAYRFDLRKKKYKWLKYQLTKYIQQKILIIELLN